MNKLILTIFICLLFQMTDAQVQPDVTPLVQPTVMIIPFAKEGEELRSVYERDDMLNLRVALTKFKEAFDQEGIPTIDFRAKIKQVQMDGHISQGNQTSIKQRVIELSGADIFVEVEAAVIEDVDGSAVTVTATAYDAFSGQVLTSDVRTTKKHYTLNFERLTQQAINYFIKDFTNNIQNKFDDILKEGRAIVLNIGFDENAEVDMDTELDDGSLLAEAIEKWVEENAYKNYFHLQGITATTMIFDEVKIPVKDANGRNYRITKFAAKLRSFLKKQGFDVSRDVVGTKVYITIN